MNLKDLAIACCIFILFFAICYVSACATRAPEYNFDEQTYIVSDGECLWDIANIYCPDGMDRRHYIDLIQDKNDLSNSIIFPGQRLVVLVATDSGAE